MRTVMALIAVTSMLSSLCHAQSTVGFSSFGYDEGLQMGSAVNNAGDVNNDGIPDYIVSSLGSFFHLYPGRVQVFSGADNSVLHTIHGDPSVLDRIGRGIDGVGDMNADGYDDFVVGAPNVNPGIGRATVFSGIDGSVLYTFFGANVSGEEFGRSVAGAGDVNNDGTPDVIVGSYGSVNGFGSGSAFVYSGLDGSLIHVVHGVTAGDSFGNSVAGGDDYNDDGHDDFVVGAFDVKNSSGDYVGSFSVFSGLDGTVLFTATGTIADQFLGESLSQAGDVNGDGVMDVIVGATSCVPGKAFVYSGIDWTILHTFTGLGLEDAFGHSVAGAGDIDGDGYDDLLVGAPSSGPVSYVQVYSGADGSIIETLFGAPQGPFNSAGHFGRSVSGIGDVSGDGFPDFIVGASSAYSGGLSTGAAFQYTSLTRPTLHFDSEIADTKLRVEWAPDGGIVDALTGTVTVTGATPGALGFYGVSLTKDDVLLFGFPLLLKDDAANVTETGGFGFGFAGEHVFPNISRQSASLAGMNVHIQFFEVAPLPGSSNGLRMTAAP